MQAYLDNAAGTRLRPEALSAMRPWLEDGPANPTGTHRRARDARRAVDDARDVIADLLGVTSGEVVFTSGGTEADDLAVHGRMAAAGGTAVCGATEHHAVLDPVLGLGGRVVPVDAGGGLDLEALAEILDGTPDVTLVSVMAANNETGVVQPLDVVAEVVARTAPSAALHTDAVQAAAWLDLRPLVTRAALVSVSAHKLGGPRGVGALVVRDGVSLAPRLLGGGQERGRRSGTHDVAGIVGFAAAAAAGDADRAERTRATQARRDRLAAALVRDVPGARITADASVRLPSILHVTVEGLSSEELLFLLDREDVAASAASSCASGALEPSHVLAAMGIAAPRARGALRLSLGWCTTEAEIDHAAAVIPTAVARLLAPG